MNYLHHYEHMIYQVTISFSTLIMIAKRVDNQLKSGRLTDIKAL